MFRVGDKVRLVRASECWSDRWGRVGDIGTVDTVYEHSVVVECPAGLWAWGIADIEPADTPHTDDDLADALELAKLLESVGEMAPSNTWAEIADW